MRRLRDASMPAGYPFISIDLLHKAIERVSTIATITDNDIKVIMQPRKTLLFHQN